MSDTKPQWVSDLHHELERRGLTNTECVHERSAYRDAAQLLNDYWDRREMHDD